MATELQAHATRGSRPGDVLVRARNLTKTFGDFVAVAGIDVDVHRGEAFGFLGPNGAGKSSTMRMVGCVSPPSGGPPGGARPGPGGAGVGDPGPDRGRAAGRHARHGAHRPREPPRVRALLRPLAR